MSYGSIIGSFEGQSITQDSNADGYTRFRSVVVLTDEHVPPTIPVWVYGALRIPGKRLYFDGYGTANIAAGEIHPGGPGYPTQFIFYDFGEMMFKCTVDEVPEPSTFGLFLAGTLAGLAVRLRRRKV